jgi:hypothetical protein
MFHVLCNALTIKQETNTMKQNAIWLTLSSLLIVMALAAVSASHSQIGAKLIPLDKLGDARLQHAADLGGE